MNVQKKNRNIGAALLFFIFGLLFFVLAVRFFTIQYTGEVKGQALAAKAAQMYLRTDVIKAKRGTIYDREGEVIAEDSASYTLVAVLDGALTADPEHPNHVVDPRKTAAELSEHISLSEQEIYDLLTKDGRKQVEFGPAGRDLSHRTKEEIEKLELPGIGFIKDTKRFYPNGVFASHLIGYAQREQSDGKPSEIVGKAGLEKSYNEMLIGKDGSLQYKGDFWNYILPNSKKQVKEPKDGKDIYLTIDKKIQTFLEDAMNKVDQDYSPSRIFAIVADPKTGAILGMGQRPTYHPVTREGIEKTWHNEVVESSFEPGSTMKIFSLAAAVEEGVFNPNTKFPSGKYYLDKKQPPIKDHNQGAGWGDITYLEGVQRSSNVGFAYLLEKMGTDTWRNYMDKFKFGQKTGISLPNEASGKILYDWPIEKVTSVFGQGTTVTSMQMIQAASAIANDGKMMKPYVVKKITDPASGEVTETKPEVSGQPLSPKSAKKVRDILETVITSDIGTGNQFYQLDGYSVAGKTGTAQIAAPGGGYLQGRENYIFSFLGMAPKDDPKLLMYVVVEKPKLELDENGAMPVSEIFKPVMKSSLQYLNIEPEEQKDAVITEIPDLTEMSVQKATQYLTDRGLKPILLGSGKQIVSYSPTQGEKLIEGEKVIIRTDGNLSVPNMKGWSKRDVLKVAKLAELKINMVGSGYVMKQNIKPKSRVSAGDQLVVNFAPQTEIIEKNKAKKTKSDEEPPLD
ncbi:penicillin-binding protein [Siminovitchia acidinfaciens]|uniref:serine-type D-Ala-D-Ala carboxypeptidase n=1 Tax=Siminovitchia acidinfaciens TaxID=2321395 RepID=A0A429Y2F7_9BACI|nr:penicillin-binding protein [Siminovitchia acidinfaciens]RST75400.1 penicillin-binding protein [Siminovitchia acidinfaciens]